MTETPEARRRRRNARKELRERMREARDEGVSYKSMMQLARALLVIEQGEDGAGQDAWSAW